MKTVESWPIVWAGGAARILSVGAMLADCRFVLPSGRRVAPFAACPWAGEDSAEMRAQPGHMQWLGGEFACLPFGAGGPVEGATPDWRGLLDGSVNDLPHGHAANDLWRLVARTPSSVELALDYPAGHDIARLTRRVAGVAGRAALAFELVIEARRDCAYPVGLHPILALPERAGALRLEADFELGLTYPATVDPGAMPTSPGQEFHDLAAVPAPGGAVDLTRLPLTAPAEDVVQLLGMGGPVRAVNGEAGFALTLDWDRDLLPSCQIWISDRALRRFPWRGKFRGLGIEPTASAFDFALPVSLAANPITRRGHATTLPITAARPITLAYRVEVTDISADVPGDVPGE